jgi:hypothetical protein
MDHEVWCEYNPEGTPWGEQDPEPCCCMAREWAEEDAFFAERS